MIGLRGLRSYSISIPPLLSRRSPPKIPPANGDIKSPQDFLKAIGRSSETKLAIENWEEFWSASGLTIKKKGVVSVQDRRYILWCMQRYRQGFKIEEFAHDPNPPKKIRGRGPSVQHGKKIRR